MLLLIGVPRGWLQTSPSVELLTHGWISEGPDLSALPSWTHILLTPSMLVLSLYHNRPRATGTLTRGHAREMRPIHSTAM